MSKIFKRPMFRKGGSTSGMNGIMTGIVDREMHAASDPNGVGGQSELKQKVEDKMALIEAISGGSGKGLDDPFTQLLLQYGPEIATAKPTGNIISTAVGAAKKPIATLLDTQAKKKATRTAVGMEALKDLSAEDTASLREKAEKLADEGAFGGNVEAAFQALVNKTFYRDPPLPSEAKKQTDQMRIASLVEGSEDALNYYTGELVVKAIENVNSGNVPGLEGKDINYSQPYIPADTDMSDIDEETGIITLKTTGVGNAQGIYGDGAVFDYKTNKWYKKQGNTLIPIGG
jgi:hypothetical protein